MAPIPPPPPPAQMTSISKEVTQNWPTGLYGTTLFLVVNHHIGNQQIPSSSLYPTMCTAPQRCGASPALQSLHTAPRDREVCSSVSSLRRNSCRVGRACRAGHVRKCFTASSSKHVCWRMLSLLRVSSRGHCSQHAAWACSDGVLEP